MLCFLSAKTRQGALDGLKTAMATRILYEFISERRMTITDSIERCLKKGSGRTLYPLALMVFLLKRGKMLIATLLHAR